MSIAPLWEYVWIDVKGNLRGKTRVMTSDLSEEWNFDGSSTGQATTENSEIVLRPVAFFKDPFRREIYGYRHSDSNESEEKKRKNSGYELVNQLVLCECYDNLNSKPHSTNTRHAAQELFQKHAAEKPWYGIEQEYTLFDLDGTPHGFPKNGYPKPQGPYYCGVGADRMFGREIAEEHLEACLYAGIQMSGLNAEVMPGQWEYQVGPCEGINAADQLWVSRYIMNRICEKKGLVCSFSPKPVPGDWNGAGCHTNFSTKAMRQKGGYVKIMEAVRKLEKKHQEHMEVYGTGNEMRLIGSHETSSINKFTHGVADRSASIRIPMAACRKQCGYLEDRRPASNMDPYLVTSKLLETVVLE